MPISSATAAVRSRTSTTLCRLTCSTTWLQTAASTSRPCPSLYTASASAAAPLHPRRAERAPPHAGTKHLVVGTQLLRHYPRPTRAFNDPGHDAAGVAAA